MAAAAKSSGTVKWFNVTKGYGFITPDQGGEDLFVHQTAIITDGFRSLKEGEPVEFFVENSDDGRAKAVQVTGPDGAAPERSGKLIVLYVCDPVSDPLSHDPVLAAGCPPPYGGGQEGYGQQGGY
ncbi:Glycine-rich protein 2 [Auxenochlorella protothecoides]|uniref:Glycine rich protein n=1 Tax=Auxenochlorella protothecoides TaxID=3075 RepID=V5NE23_AUXPR|nr:Glycine-rich protein 2 [Auxenochlorella protothecoides]AHA86566.1 glycine rich protein [Auxenochlorella protothecoides]KFM24370.1 Glycine-rich protein 2 [Auxenochlorella protothecoides]